MKFCRVVLEKMHVSKKVEMAKKSSIRNFLFNCAAFNWVLTATAKIRHNSWIFASLNFLMYYSNKRLKPTTSFVIIRRKKRISNSIEPINLSLYQCHVRFLQSFTRAASHWHERAQEKLCPATLVMCSALILAHGLKNEV